MVENNSAKKKGGKKLANQVLMLFEKRGRKAFEIAKEAMLKEKITYKPVRDALRYFMQETWFGVQHPALVSFACEAVGGDPNATTLVGAAMVLLGGTADIHDDIIDQSKIKGSKQTVFGKFGRDLALLAGDALLFEGLMLLYEACEKLDPRKKQMIMNLTKEAFFELGSAEAKEMKFKGDFSMPPEEYRNIIRMKASVIDAYARIGAIIGHADSKQIKAMANYGRALGVLTTLREDFVDMFEPDELRNRFKNECLPLPVLYALQNKETRRKIIPKLENEKMTEKEAYEVLELVWDIKEVRSLRKEMHIMAEDTLQSLEFIKTTSLRKEAQTILHATVEDLDWKD
jgi:geranylgeranyl pyrophosphate synthase